MTDKNRDGLVRLLGHPEVRERTHQGIFNGLSGSSRIDYAIGVVEQTLADLQPGRVRDEIQEAYQKVRENPKYRFHFSNGFKPEPLPERKPECYKACNGF